VRLASYITEPHLVSDPLLARRVDPTKVMGRIRLWALVVAFASCGPPLTQPSSQDLTGHWTSADHIGPVFNLELVISQNSDGTVAGTWSSDVSPASPLCPPELSDKAAGSVSGTNTVLEVRLSVLGVGDFQGQAINSGTLRGSFQSCGNAYLVTWSLAGPAPAG
jgi:hypothetical protein